MCLLIHQALEGRILTPHLPGQGLSNVMRGYRRRWHPKLWANQTWGCQWAPGSWPPLPEHTHGWSGPRLTEESLAFLPPAPQLLASMRASPMEARAGHSPLEGSWVSTLCQGLSHAKFLMAN